MEQKIYDLNEYSLEVKDGKAVLELKKREFKVGDFICFGDGYIGIYHSKDTHRGKFYTRCHLSGNKFVSYCEWHSDKKVCLATVEQRQRLLDAIDRNGFVWLPETLEMKKKYEFDDGVFVANNDGGLFIHYKAGDTDFSHGSYVYWDWASDDITLGCNSNMTTGVRLANEEEKQSLLDRLAKNGYEWDPENKRLMKKRWRAKKGEEYWHAEFWQGITRAFSSVEMGREVDDFRYKQGNYYGTKEGVLRDIEEVERNKKEK